MENEKKSKHRVLRIFIGVIIVFALIAAFVISSFLKANSEIKPARLVSDNFIQAVLDSSSEKAYQLTSDEFKSTIKTTKFAELVSTVNNNVASEPTESSWKIVNNNLNKLAVISYTASGPEGSGSIEITLQRIGEQWYVNYVYFPAFAIKGYTIQ